MQTIYSSKFMQDNCGCYSEKSGKLEKYILKGRKEISYLDILNSDIPLKDKYWFFCRKIFTKEQNKQIAITLAEIVLPIYEEKYPENKSPREIIEAAKLYITGDISLNQLMSKRRAASYAANAADYADAAAAFYVPYAAYYAASAVDVAYSAVDAAYYAADAAYYAASYAVDASAAAASSDDSYKQKLEKALTNFIESN